MSEPGQIVAYGLSVGDIATLRARVSRIETTNWQGDGRGYAPSARSEKHQPAASTFGRAQLNGRGKRRFSQVLQDQ